jgi:hypothetical protein
MIVTMFGVAYSEIQHGAQPGDVHLITNATVTAPSSVALYALPGGAFFHQSAISHNEYAGALDSAPLRLSGLIFPRST